MKFIEWILHFLPNSSNEYLPAELLDWTYKSVEFMRDHEMCKSQISRILEKEPDNKSAFDYWMKEFKKCSIRL